MRVYVCSWAPGQNSSDCRGKASKRMHEWDRPGLMQYKVMECLANWWEYILSKGGNLIAAHFCRRQLDLSAARPYDFSSEGEMQILKCEIWFSDAGIKFKCLKILGMF